MPDRGVRADGTDTDPREARQTAARTHGHEGDPCPRCKRTLEAVHFSNHVIVYCPDCQNDGEVYKNRRMSKLLR